MGQQLPVLQNLVDEVLVVLFLGHQVDDPVEVAVLLTTLATSAGAHVQADVAVAAAVMVRLFGVGAKAAARRRAYAAGEVGKGRGRGPLNKSTLLEGKNAKVHAAKSHTI